MATEPEHLIFTILREIRAKQDEHTQRFDSLEGRLRHVEKQLDGLSKLVTYSLGQNTETQFKQSQQQSQIDDLFDRLEKLLSEPRPSSP